MSRMLTTFVQITESPIPLTVPEEGQVAVRDDTLFLDFLGIEKDQFSRSLGPFYHETVLFERSPPTGISIKAKWAVSANPL